ncbi:MAG: hypothetical protein IBX50_08285 [Marinospirillum sp.]|uniref:hypothetical protein n=1 Tax=Marinospirillum sp. TaxID=2183934 RepID=UPI001A000CD7|nr:hypothetical protein [Marinospirillum sp.]MBE0506704.1 hypothetical protein [Marinospirillum sp.]
MADLTEAEIRLIHQGRESQQAEKDACSFRLNILKLALDYEAWLQSEGRGSSFSAFVNEFNYDKGDCKLMYREVQKVRGELPQPRDSQPRRVHHRNGGIYMIIKEPDDRLLEDCGEPFYEYENVHSGQIWLRRQSEMEDGRFVPVN